MGDREGWVNDRPRCHCGVYIDCHQHITDHAPRKGNRLVLWYRDHSITYHVLGAVWTRLPEKARWRIVGWLDDHTDRFCWSDLVDAALARPEEDACDLHLPLPGVACNKECRSLGPGHDVPHECSCHCGKRSFLSEGRVA